MNPLPGLHIGFISTRFDGTDGVSLETEKWATVLERLGHTCFYFAGICDRPSERSMVIPEAFFRDPVIHEINQIAYSRNVRPPELTRQIIQLKNHLKVHLLQFLQMFGIDLIIVENALAIPINIPLGLALTELIAETGIPTIGHHHDMFWERKRFLFNCVWDYINMAFPPHLPTIHHVVINSSASNQLGLRTGVSSTMVPNVMDFENPPPPPDDYAQKARSDLEIGQNEYLILQPTRIVQRKGIEHAIELVSRLKLPAKLVITHASGDEGYEYEQRVRDFSDHMNAPVLFISKRIKQFRGQTDDGRRIFTLADMYQSCDLVTYPSDIEGFGNAFLEAIYYRCPIVVNNYAIYAFDIRPKGFRTVEFDGFVNEEAIRSVRELLSNSTLREEVVQINYELAKRHYSYATLERRLVTIISRFFGE